MTRRSLLKLSLLSTASAFAVAVLLWPSDAFAWGPLAHLHFSQGALSDLSMLSPALRIVLGNFASEFLYGSLAGDIIVGKNLAEYGVHSHNWKVGFRVLDRARTDEQKAFSLGFLSHLAVDTVAHNYYVPYKTVQGYGVRASGHAYWELRYDQRLPADLWKLARHVSQRQFREHDDHLEECLADSYVIPFNVSKKLFGGMVHAARLKKWQKMSEVIAGEKNLLLHSEEIGETRNLAVGNVVDMLRHADNAKCVQVDPTGERNLHVAGRVRNQLRKRNDVSEKHRDHFVRESRFAFRNGIYGRLALPELPDHEAAAEPTLIAAAS